eukprot:766133-Hanusia_phi.AAC.1
MTWPGRVPRSARLSAATVTVQKLKFQWPGAKLDSKGPGTDLAVGQSHEPTGVTVASWHAAVMTVVTGAPRNPSVAIAAGRDRESVTERPPRRPLDMPHPLRPPRCCPRLTHGRSGPPG